MNTFKRTYVFAISLFLFVVCAAYQRETNAQTLRIPRSSQKASVMQTIGVTDVKITYSRPGLKGRKIWGDPPANATGTATLDGARTGDRNAPLVPYGHVWRTGANEATQFEVSDDVSINGQPLPAGRYSLHTIPGKDEWTIIFNKDDGQWGSFQYDEKKDALRIKAIPRTVSESQEWLSFTIEPVGENSARVNLHWEKVNVPFTVEIKDVNALALEKARAFLSTAKPDDWQTRMQAANFAFQNKISTEEAMAWLDQSIKIRENLSNLGLKARVLAEQGKTAEAIATGEKALRLGKEANANAQALSNLEKLVAEWKTKK